MLEMTTAQGGGEQMPLLENLDPPFPCVENIFSLQLFIHDAVHYSTLEIIVSLIYYGIV